MLKVEVGPCAKCCQGMVPLTTEVKLDADGEWTPTGGWGYGTCDYCKAGVSREISVAMHILERRLKPC